MKRILSHTRAPLVSATLLFTVPYASTNGPDLSIGIIDFYGLRSISEQQVRQALQIKEGDRLTDSLKEVQARLETLPNVQQANLSVICCEAGKLILYVGISEKGTPTLRFRAAPRGSIRLPNNLVQ